tara:strand:+ start:6075 stop:6677 length:603 start_codon:yes stop_codon:yes gene_type:complete
MSSPSLFFPTPIWASKLDNYKDANEEIYQYIKKLQKEDNQGVIRSNIKGWHSKDFNLKDKEAQNFIKLISPKIEQVLIDMDWDSKKQLTRITSMWAIINKGGAANARHHHGNSAISAAYYVRAPNNCGDIVFYDPRPAPVYSHPWANKPNSLNAMVNSITPDEGVLVLFPSYLDHSVNTNESDDERIVISFNISLISNNV